MDSLLTAIVGLLVGAIDIVTGPIPFLASSGILLGLFALLWAAFAVALARDPSRIDAAWLRLRRLPLPVQLLAWLVLLPVLAGIGVWRTAWPRVARLAVVAGIAGWNLVAFLPRPA